MTKRNYNFQTPQSLPRYPLIEGRIYHIIGSNIIEGPILEFQARFLGWGALEDAVRPSMTNPVQPRPAGWDQQIARFDNGLRIHTGSSLVQFNYWELPG